MRTLIILGLTALFAFYLPVQAWGDDEEDCSACDYLVQLIGDFHHFKIKKTFEIFGVSGDTEAAFYEEVYGPSFSISVSHLRAGKYTIVIGESENTFHRAGKRIFNVSCGDTPLADNFDIFVKAGGYQKVCYITGEVEHVDDSLHGPLTITFSALENYAKFSTLEIRNADGGDVVNTKASDFADRIILGTNQPPETTGPEIWKDPLKPVDERVHDLIRRMTLEEKIQQIRNSTPSVKRLGVPAYDFWNEALHGVARAGNATVFPQAIGMAATWDAPLAHAEAAVISTEARAINNQYRKEHKGDCSEYHGLTFWSPNLNIYRDPRWGRGQETYGEDPFLTGTLGVAFIQGLQGDDMNNPKAMACAKHYAVHSGPESERHVFNVDPPERDFYETYLPQFEMAVREGRVAGVMGAYNSVYGKPACANPLLLTDLLRKQWGFDGYIVSDCGAIHDIYAKHHFASTSDKAAAAAVKAGCDICCGRDYASLVKAVQSGLVSEGEIDEAVVYALKARFRLGLFDSVEQGPYANIGMEQNDSSQNEAVALKVAEESMVLLKNDGALPLKRDKIKRVLVVGKNADSIPVLVGNYSGTPSRPVTILEGIKTAAGQDIAVDYQAGCPLALNKAGGTTNATTTDAESANAAIEAAKSADVVIYVGGITAELEGEEMSKANAFDGFDGGDRTRIELPSVQEDLLKALHDTGKPVILVNCSGGSMAMPWEVENLPAIIQAWYPGEQGGRAVAEVLFGEVNPGGRLPVTFYQATDQLPPFEDYSMSNRTYRYFSDKPLFAFGHGLSYAKFAYKSVRLKHSKFSSTENVEVSFKLKNTGGVDGDEVAQVYFRHVNSAVPQPKLALCGFARVQLKAGESATLSLNIAPERFRYWDTEKKQYVIEAGDYEMLIGAASDDIRLRVPFSIE